MPAKRKKSDDGSSTIKKSTRKKRVNSDSVVAGPSDAKPSGPVSDDSGSGEDYSNAGDVPAFVFILGDLDKNSKNGEFLAIDPETAVISETGRRNKRAPTTIRLDKTVVSPITLKIRKAQKEVDDYNKLHYGDVDPSMSLRDQILLSGCDLSTKSMVLKKFDDNEKSKNSFDQAKFLNWTRDVMRLPFGKTKPLPITLEDGPEKIKEYLKSVREQLDKAVAGHDHAKDEILDFIARIISNPDGKGNILALIGPKGSGKCFAKDTEVLMFDGSSKKVQDIVIGDVLMGDDFTARTVTDLGRGREEMFKVTHLDSGDTYTVNKSHILCLKLDGKDLNMIVRDYLDVEESIRGRLMGYSKDLGTREVVKSPISVESVGEGDYYGFTLDGNEKFLLKNGIVTHNTRLVRKGVAEALGRPFHVINLGGMNDVHVLSGHDVTYTGSKYGRLAQILIQSQCENPVVYLDEMDKIQSGSDKGMEIFRLLTHILDEEQNQEFYDEYFGSVKLDLSKILFVASMNNLDDIEPVLRDRLKVIRIKGLDVPTKVKIIQNYTMPELCALVNMPETSVHLSEDVIRYIINNKCPTEEGCRQLKKKVETIIQKLNTMRITASGLFENAQQTLELTSQIVDDLLKHSEETSGSDYANMYN